MTRVSEFYNALVAISPIFDKLVGEILPIILIYHYYPLSGRSSFTNLVSWSESNPGWGLLVYGALSEPTYFEEQVQAVAEAVSIWRPTDD
jgi:hypothetical protein